MQKKPLALLAGRNLFDLIEWKHGDPQSTGGGRKAQRPFDEPSSSLAATSRRPRQATQSRADSHEGASLVLMQGQTEQGGRFGDLPETHPDTGGRTSGRRRRFPDGTAGLQVRKGTEVFDADRSRVRPGGSDRHFDYYYGEDADNDGFPDRLNCGRQVNPDGSAYNFPRTNCRTRFIS